LAAGALPCPLQRAQLKLKLRCERGPA
jgi:hypothetical protein